MACYCNPSGKQDPLPVPLIRCYAEKITSNRDDIAQAHATTMFSAFHKVTVTGSFLLYMATTVCGGLLHPVLSQYQGCSPGQQPYAACCQLHVHSASDGQLAADSSLVATISSPSPVCLFCQLLATPQLCQFNTSLERSDDVLDKFPPSVAITEPLQQTSEYHSRAPPAASF